MKDDKRDCFINGIIEVIKGYTNHFSMNKIEAAELLKAHINKYGKRIDKMNYNAETVVLNDLIDGIETNTELKDAVNLLGISDWITELKASNTEFNRLYELRAEEEAGKTKLVLRELRNESVKTYRDLIKYFEAASIMHPSEVYEPAANKINEFIDKYNSLRRKSKPEDDDFIDEAGNEE